MSSETWQEIWGLLALSLWIAFIVAIVWFQLLHLRERSRAARTGERPRPRESDTRAERTPSTTP